MQLEIRHGDYVSISGPSGCGKSTLLSILGLLDSPTSGSYHLRGEAVERNVVVGVAIAGAEWALEAVTTTALA